MEALEENNISYYCDKSRIYSDDLQFVLDFPCEEMLLRQKRNAVALMFNIEVDSAYMRKIIYILVPIAQDRLKMDFTIFPPFSVTQDMERNFIHLNYGGYARDWKAFYQNKSIYEINPNNIFLNCPN
jgi:hypothetical protein